MMKAAVIDRYGDPSVFTIQQLPQPSYKPHEVLIKVAAASVNPIDWKIRRGMLRFLLPIKLPAILGYDICGEIVAVGSDVTNFQVGDWVLARSYYLEGRGYAQYIVLDDKALIVKPASLTAIEAASIPLAAETALQALRNFGRIKPGNEVMIMGAAGGVGVFAVQLAKLLGANVTAVCSSSAEDLVKSLGADVVIDYTKAPIFSADKQYDIIFDAVAKHTFSYVKNHLTKHGIYVTTVPSLESFTSMIKNLLSSRKNYFILSKNRTPDLAYLIALFEQHKLKTVVDSVYHLEDVAKAHERSETQHAHGKIVLDIAASF